MWAQHQGRRMFARQNHCDLHSLIIIIIMNNTIITLIMMFIIVIIIITIMIIIIIIMMKTPSSWCSPEPLLQIISDDLDEVCNDLSFDSRWLSTSSLAADFKRKWKWKRLDQHLREWHSLFKVTVNEDKNLCDLDFYEMHIKPYAIYGNFPFYYFVDDDHKPIVNYNL